jgi:hypothetical protein
MKNKLKAIFFLSIFCTLSITIISCGHSSSTIDNKSNTNKEVILSFLNSKGWQYLDRCAIQFHDVWRSFSIDLFKGVQYDSENKELTVKPIWTNPETLNWLNKQEENTRYLCTGLNIISTPEGLQVVKEKRVQAITLLNLAISSVYQLAVDYTQADKPIEKIFSSESQAVSFWNSAQDDLLTICRNNGIEPTDVNWEPQYW